MLLRNFFIFIYLSITVFLFATLETSLSLWMSFMGNALILTFITYYHIFIERRYSPFLSTYIVFNFLFFLVAPLAQISEFNMMEAPTFTHHFPFSELTFIKTNGLIAIFNIVFFLFYVAGKDYIKLKKQIPTRKSYSLSNIFFFIVLSILVLIINYDFFLDELSRPSWLTSTYSVSYLLIVKKVLFLMPLAGVILCIDYYKNSKINTQKWILATAMLFFLIALVLLFKNPLTEKRNALGPIYLLLLFLFVPKLLNSNVKSTLLLFVVMIIGFPLSQFLTHIDYGFDEILSNPSLLFAKNQLSEGYMSLNYDAFINIGVVMEHVEFDGLSYGYQLLSALLFFVPRSLWVAKPDASGLIVGNHVIDHYDFYFANLSNPYIAEGYMNFGIIGVIFMAIVLALSIVYFLTWLNSSNLFKKSIAFYFAMHLLFLLRGDFTNGFAYFIGTFIGLYLLPKVILAFVNLFFYKKVWVQKS
ncbi:O-antigen polymerase [Nonlabens ulvanivorans]|nr:O-antigen polymerase [Nonlabens ulvanivorans]